MKRHDIPKICLFAGTTEGRKLAEFLSSQPVNVQVCVATDYGGELLPQSENVNVSAKRLPEAEIEQLLKTEHFHVVIDATHPYAVSITSSIETACSVCSTPYLRLLRSASDLPGDVVTVPDIPSAVSFLNQTEGAVLLTTGSKELNAYTGIRQFEERVYARVLPMESSLTACKNAALKPSHIIAMQGPFSEDLNKAMMSFLNIRWMVTKDSGDAGGFQAKIKACGSAGAGLVVIGRPVAEEKGLSYAEVVVWLTEHFRLRANPSVVIAGIGPGHQENMTCEVRSAILQADCLIGAGRMLESVRLPGQDCYEAISPGEISDFIESHPQYSRIVVLMSGDTGFFSGTKKLIPLLKHPARVLPGISSLSYFCAKCQRSYEAVKVISLHGREGDITSSLREGTSLFVLTGGKDGINRLCRQCMDAGVENVKISVGEKLSYPEEKITSGTARELVNGTYDSLSVALIEPETEKQQETPIQTKEITTDQIVTHGLPDSMFLRAQTSSGIIPMTKSEVRSLCLSKLQLTADAVCWDIGAGSGSVSVEMARQASEGIVYAVEKQAEAAALIRDNRDRFGLSNLQIITGTAPISCEKLPVPTHVFIGGSSGNMRQILDLILDRNPCARIVAAAVTLESIAELTTCIRELPFTETEVTVVNISKDRHAGRYHLMQGQNPVYIFTCMQKQTEERSEGLGREK